jgi:hypothetical protein
VRAPGGHKGPPRGLRKTQRRCEKEIDAKALMVIGSLCPISIEGVISLIRGLRWGIGPEGGKALSSHHIWTFIPPAGLPVHPYGNIGGGGGVVGGTGTYVCTEGLTD